MARLVLLALLLVTGCAPRPTAAPDTGPVLLVVNGRAFERGEHGLPLIRVLLVNGSARPVYVRELATDATLERRRPDGRWEALGAWHGHAFIPEAAPASLNPVPPGAYRGLPELTDRTAPGAGLRSGTYRFRTPVYADAAGTRPLGGGGVVSEPFTVE